MIVRMFFCNVVKVFLLRVVKMMTTESLRFYNTLGVR